jgi:hypothetical protein
MGRAAGSVDARRRYARDQRLWRSPEYPNLQCPEVPIHLVQLLLPLYDNDGRAFPPGHYAAVRTTLTDRFNGLTAYTRAPAQGLWSESDGPPKRDDIVVYEVMTDTLDRAWWAEFRRSLERRFAQEELVIRALAVERV